VGYADRQKVLREIHRMLVPGGVCIISGHNRHGPGFGEQPAFHVACDRNPIGNGWRVLKSAWSCAIALRNHHRLRTRNEVHKDWAVMNCAAHNFSIVVMHTSFAEQQRQIRGAGLFIEAMFDSQRGERVTEAAPIDDCWWFHHVARNLREPGITRVGTTPAP
jgi:SAM-dependent methyltransferase